MKIKKLLGISFLSLFSFIATCSCASESKSSSVKNTSSECQHQYALKKVEATCVIQGYTEHICQICNASYIDSYVAAKGHDYEEREQNYKCSRCNHYEDEGFSFELITPAMARYNDSYDGLVDTYQIIGVSDKGIENGNVSFPRKHLGCEVSGAARGCLYNQRRSIKSLEIPSTCKYIGSSLMTSDGGYIKPEITIPLEKVIFSSMCSKINISHTAFQWCYNLKIIQYPSNCFSKINHDDNVGNHFLFEDTAYYKQNVKTKDGLCLLDNMLLSSETKNVKSEVIIKEDTYLIGNYVFKDNTNIKSATIPSSVTYIGKSAFYNCLNLKSIIYNGSEEQFKKITIEETAFYNCQDIEYIYWK